MTLTALYTAVRAEADRLRPVLTAASALLEDAVESTWRALRVAVEQTGEGGT